MLCFVLEVFFVFFMLPFFTSSSTSYDLVVNEQKMILNTHLFCYEAKKKAVVCFFFFPRVSECVRPEILKNVSSSANSSCNGAVTMHLATLGSVIV